MVDKFADTDLARLAAFIDGEGCITIRVNSNGRWKRGRQLLLRLQIANTDIRLILWLMDTFEMGFVHLQKRGGPRKTMHYWEVTGVDVERLLVLCYSYLIIKKEQADIAIAFQKLIGAFPRGRGRIIPIENFEARESLKHRLHVLKKEGVA